MGKDQRSKQHGLDVRRIQREKRAEKLLAREYTPEIWETLDPEPRCSCPAGTYNPGNVHEDYCALADSGQR